MNLQQFNNKQNQIDDLTSLSNQNIYREILFE